MADAKQRTVAVEDGFVVIRMPINETLVESKPNTAKGKTRGKSLFVASTSGFTDAGISVNGSPVRVMCMVTIANPEAD